MEMENIEKLSIRIQVWFQVSELVQIRACLSIRHVLVHVSGKFGEKG